MKNILLLKHRFGLKKLLCLTVLGVAVGLSAPAHAQRYDGPHDGPPGHGWDNHHGDWRHDRWHRHWRPEPEYVSAPPVYAPQPAYASPGINLILPFNFR